MFQAHARGFTLLEILIAITVTAIIGVGTVTLLSQTIRVNDVLELRGGQLRSLQLADSVISRDYEQIIARPVRDGFGDLQPAVRTTDTTYDIQFTRTGWRDPRQLLQNLKDMDQIPIRSELQRVAYAIEEEELIRYYWPVLDQPQESEPVRQVLLSEVSDFSIRLLDENNEWQTDWPTAAQLGSGKVDINTAIPRIIEVNFTHRVYGRLQRLFALAGYEQPIMPPNAGQPAAGQPGGGANNPDGTDGQNPGQQGGQTDGGQVPIDGSQSGGGFQPEGEGGAGQVPIDSGGFQ
ncbi:type II secretion system minor pseudopilin GspJ [Allohahella marinimesophila]